MKDFYGVEVELGDKVVCMVKNYRCLQEAEVISIATKTIQVETDKQNPRSWSKYRITSDQFVIVGKF